MKALACLLLAAFGGLGGDGLRDLVRELASPEDAAAALSGLEARGAPAVEAVLDGFTAAPPAARRQRAELLRRAGTGDHVERALSLCGDPDPGVRRRLAAFLARPDLGAVAGEARREALVRLVRDDPSLTVRRRAAAGLGEASFPGAAEALAELASELTGEDARACAEALTARSDGAPAILALVRAAFAGEASLGPASLAQLFGAYGRALAEVPGGGESPADRAPFFLALRHPAAEVRARVGRAFEEGLARLDELGEEARLDRWLAGFEADGWRPREMLYRRVHLALDQGRLAAAEDHAARLLAASGGGVEDPDGPAGEAGGPNLATWRFFALHFLAVCDFARGDFPRAREGFLRAREVVLELIAQRVDLRPALREARRRLFPLAPTAAALQADRWLSLGLEELWIATAWLAEGGAAAASDAAVHARRSHLAQLRAQLVAASGDAAPVGRTWDELLDRDLSPRRLILRSPELPGWGGERSLELTALLGRLLAAVSPREMPGFEPLAAADPGSPEAAALADVFLDDERFELLRRIEEADLQSAEREWQKVRLDAIDAGDDLEALQNHPARLRYLQLFGTTRRRNQREGHGDRARRAEVYRELVELRTPSSLALVLAGDLREEGRTAEAEALSRTMLAALEAGVAGLGTVQAAMTSARLELSIASSLMDADRPREAEERGLAAVRRLEELQRSLEERQAQLGDDPAVRASFAAALDNTRTMLSSGLLSLAVNANVRMKDPERALGYFERAYELDQSDFMRVLLACYRARSGHGQEARALLATVKASPQTYYNLACTYALLGDADEALDWLQREFDENHPTPGSLARQKEWARGDPDLASLREHPRFQRLVAPD